MGQRTAQEEFEYTKEVIRIRNSKDRQYKGQKKKDKQRSTRHYTEKDRATRTPLKPGVNSGTLEGSSSCSTRGTRRFTLVTNPEASRE